jgi:hypothetical protein
VSGEGGPRGHTAILTGLPPVRPVQRPRHLLGAEDTGSNPSYLTITVQLTTATLSLGVLICHRSQLLLVEGQLHMHKKGWQV